MKKRDAILIYLPEDLKQEFQIACIKEKVGMSEAIRNMIVNSARYNPFEGEIFTTRFLVQFMGKVNEKLIGESDIRKALSFDEDSRTYTLSINGEEKKNDNLVELMWDALVSSISK